MNVLFLIASLLIYTVLSQFTQMRVPINGQMPPNMNQMYQNQGNSVTINCDSSPHICRGRTLTCLHESCKYECHEVASCANTRFISSPITKELEISCHKPNACQGIRVLSSAIKTMVQCEDHACISMKLYCKSTFADTCELKCQSNGCNPQIMSNNFNAANIPNRFSHIQNPFPQTPVNNFNLRMFGNEVYCQGNINDCKVVASNEFSFIYGTLTCQLTSGKCLLECADSFGETSCKGSTYNCKTARSLCMCTDQRHNNNNNMFGQFNSFGQRNPGQQVPRSNMYDCPIIKMPTLAPTNKPTVFKAKPKSKAKAKTNKTKSKAKAKQNVPKL